VQLVDDQIAAENADSVDAEASAIKALHENLGQGNIDKLPKAKLLIANLFPHVLASIEADQQVVARGRSAKCKGWLRAIPADVASVIAMRCALRLVLGGGFKTLDGAFGATFQRISVAIAREWVMEVQIRQAEKINPMYYQAAMRGLDRANVSSRKHIQMTVQRVVKNTLDGVYDCPLCEQDLLQLGKFGLDACVNAGLLEVERSRGQQGIIVVYRLPVRIAEFLGDAQAAARLAPMNHSPMLAPPLPWEGLAGGGFYTERKQVRAPLVAYRRKVRRSALRDYREACSQMPMVYQYCNYVQSTAFTMDDAMFQHVQRVWQAGGGALGIPLVRAPEKPAFPFGESWEKATASEEDLRTFQNWKRATTRWHEAVRKHRSTLWEMANFVKHARKYSGKPVYFPVFLDSRGRLYYRCTPNPQGSDAAKAVLHFADKKPLGKDGVFWLKVHIANCFGFDQPQFKDRAAWTDEHWDRLVGALERPEDSGVYDSADSPLCALAGVLELSRAYASGHPESYETGLPVHMDATCSGLQHFSAMLRDERGGAFVNLLPGGTAKADIYRKVAELAQLQTARDAAGGVLEAKAWLDLGVPRALAKGPVMTYVYGATLMSVREGIEEWLAAEGWRHEHLMAGPMATYMAKLLFKAIEDVVPAAAAAMRWLRSLMREVPRDTAVQWVTPLGFTVNHDYQEEDRTRVRVRSAGVEYVVMYVKKDQCKLSRMQNAISPNFVHSLDGTHLGMTALRMQAAGLSMVCIHDSFGTHPSDAGIMHECIRSAFIRMYERDVLGDLAHQLGVSVPACPTGSLDLAGIKDSEFFFC